jgi:hypothetical protein
MKVSVIRKGNRIKVDVWDENTMKRSITLTVTENCDSSEGIDVVECELVVGSAIITADGESVTVRNKVGDEIAVYLAE